MYIGEEYLSVESFHIFSTPLALILIIAVSLGLFINLWLMNLKVINRKLALTESVFEKQFKSLILSVQSDRHDMNNHLTVISGLIQIGKFESAKEYVNNLVGEIIINNKAIMLKNPTLAALIYSKYNRFRQSNVQLDIQVHSDLIVHCLSTTDVVRLLTNLLDNAFDEVSNLSGDERTVWLELSETDESLMLEVCNSTMSSGFNSKLLQAKESTKSSTGDRGYGLSIVQEIVKKYEGEITVNVVNNRFHVVITFPKKVYL